jgi:hypothetical protein
MTTIENPAHGADRGGARDCSLHRGENSSEYSSAHPSPQAARAFGLATDTGAQSWAAIVDFRDKRTAVAAYERGGQ